MYEPAAGGTLSEPIGWCHACGHYLAMQNTWVAESPAARQSQHCQVNWIKTVICTSLPFFTLPYLFLPCLCCSFVALERTSAGLFVKYGVKLRIILLPVVFVPLVIMGHGRHHFFYCKKKKKDYLPVSKLPEGHDWWGWMTMCSLLLNWFKPRPICEVNSFSKWLMGLAAPSFFSCTANTAFRFCCVRKAKARLFSPVPSGCLLSFFFWWKF